MLLGRKTLNIMEFSKIAAQQNATQQNATQQNDTQKNDT